MGIQDGGWRSNGAQARRGDGGKHHGWQGVLVLVVRGQFGHVGAAAALLLLDMLLELGRGCLLSNVMLMHNSGRHRGRFARQWHTVNVKPYPVKETRKQEKKHLQRVLRAARCCPSPGRAPTQLAGRNTTLFHPPCSYCSPHCRIDTAVAFVGCR